MGTAAATAALGMVSTEQISAKAASEDSPERPLKVLLLNGSPRRKGNTFTLLKEIAQQLERNGIGSEIVQLGNGNVHGCADCGGCAGGKGRCVFDDDPVNLIAEKMKTCDGFIVGSPVYYGMPAGQVVAALQRLAYAMGGVFNGKPAAAVTVCRRGGATASLQTLQMAFQLLHMPLISSQYWNIAYGRAEGEVEKDEEGMQTMRVLADNMAYTLRQFATGTAPKPHHEGRKFTSFIR